MSSTLRRLEKRDLPQLVALCREHAQYEQAGWNEYERVAKLESLLLTRDDVRCWVIDDEGELVGFATAAMELSTWDAARYLHLDCLYLRAAYRGRGLGMDLIAEVARAAVELGAINLQWQTPLWNEGAARFYRRLGASSVDKLRFKLSPEQCAVLTAKPGTD